MTPTQIAENLKQAVKTNPYKNAIKSVSLFGSSITKSKNANDIDVLIDFNQDIGYFTLSEIQEDFEKKLNKPVDLVTKNSLSKYFRDDVLKQAQKVYESE